jgi:hypothetical protein
MQGPAGGTVTQPVIYDPTTGLVSGGAPGFFGGFPVDGFVEESAVPEPGSIVLLGSPHLPCRFYPRFQTP